MRRAGCVAFLLLAGLTAGMSSDGCSAVVPGVTARSAPQLTSEVSPDNPRFITLSADVSQYPDARTINWDFGDGSAATNLGLPAGASVTHAFSGGGAFMVQFYA